MEHIPLLDRLDADRDDGRSASSSPGTSISAGPDIPVELARQHEPLYKFLLNKWYFDELYDIIFVRPVKWLGRLFGRAATAG